MKQAVNTESKGEPELEKKIRNASHSGLAADKIDSPRNPAGKHVAFFLDHLRGGGMQKVWLIIAGALATRGHRVDLLLCEAEGALRAQIPKQVRVVELTPSPLIRAGCQFIAADTRGLAPFLELLFAVTKASATLPYFPDLVRYLSNEEPFAIYAASAHMNLEASIARKQAGATGRLILSDHIFLAAGHPLVRGLSRFYLPPLLRRAYESATATVAVSDGVGDDVAARTGLARDRIITIYNPAVTPQLLNQAEEPLDHPWFQPGEPPVILGAGRLGQAKDFPNLIRAFSRVRKKRPVRLVILGEAKHPKKTAKRCAQLMALADELGVAADVELPGFIQNPYRYMRHAGVFVLSSRYEGLGNVLIEALACGCPAVSTDCPSGPAEILGNGEYGALVPVGDDAALAEAIQSVLDNPPQRNILRKRAAMFSVDRAVDRYESLLF